MSSLNKKIVALYDQEWAEDADYDNFKVIEYGDWINCGEFELRSSIVTFECNCYQINEHRTGRYPNWKYGEEEVFEVVPKTVTTIVWEKVE